MDNVQRPPSRHKSKAIGLNLPGLSYNQTPELPLKEGHNYFNKFEEPQHPIRPTLA
eukprot:CAMPEP_0201281610 /NCGR_PEP_ID=MMETSP1317-20130820/3480_1 /ASSEMBLY_ACC=CAM_ASM_000770 /TAXON_ID=187299 /ORGANISM="Undescribed Undescribed, Strain Undescribed" /LENGTH=55 /DNA_ID=CAMNT_0047591917 /DNA_START=315 /DNA_END=482 /DNA_ORIENTATION=+